MYAKLTGSSTRFHSPSQMNSDKCTFPYGGTQALKQKNVRFIIQCADKMSQRMDHLKMSDPLLEQDLINCFLGSLQQLRINLGMADA